MPKKKSRSLKDKVESEPEKEWKPREKKIYIDLEIDYVGAWNREDIFYTKAHGLFKQLQNVVLDVSALENYATWLAKKAGNPETSNSLYWIIEAGRRFFQESNVRNVALIRKEGNEDLRTKRVTTHEHKLVEFDAGSWYDYDERDLKAFEKESSVGESFFREEFVEMKARDKYAAGEQKIKKDGKRFRAVKVFVNDPVKFFYAGIVKEYDDPSLALIKRTPKNPWI